MPQVSVKIAGRAYRLACGEGEEPRLTQLAAMVDAKTSGIREAFGEIGDQRIAVMAAITLADELSEATRKLAEAQREVDRLQGERGAAEASVSASARALRDSLEDAAMKIEQIAQTLNPAPKV